MFVCARGCGFVLFVCAVLILVFFVLFFCFLFVVVGVERFVFSFLILFVLKNNKLFN